MLYSRIYEWAAAEATLRHATKNDYFFFPAIGLAGPFRVRALVWVR